MEKPLPHADAALERRGLLGRLPTHSALSPDPPLYKGGTIHQALTEKETMRGLEGTRRRVIAISAHPHTRSLGRGARAGEVGTDPLLTPPPGGEHSLPGGPWLCANELPCPSGRGHPPDLCPPPPPLWSSHAPGGPCYHPSLVIAITHPHWAHPGPSPA